MLAVENPNDDDESSTDAQIPMQRNAPLFAADISRTGEKRTECAWE